MLYLVMETLPREDDVVEEEQQDEEMDEAATE